MTSKHETINQELSENAKELIEQCKRDKIEEASKLMKKIIFGWRQTVVGMIPRLTDEQLAYLEDELKSPFLYDEELARLTRIKREERDLIKTIFND